MLMMSNLLLTISLLLCLSASVRDPSIERKELIAATGSMLPNIPIKSRLIIDESFYDKKNPARFDIVIVRPAPRRDPEDTVANSSLIVCRVIGLPGETIALRGGRVYINGRRIKEPFRIRQCPRMENESFPCGEMSRMRIPPDEYFLLADNRAESEDSRLWKPQTVRRSDVLAKVVKILSLSTANQPALAADSP